MLTFNLHTKSVFCCDLSKDSSLAVSGGEDDKAFVWRTADANLQFECTGHEDSVIVTKFNCNSKLLATGDMKGIIKIWESQTGNCIADFEMEELTWLDWHPILENVFLYGTSEGNCYLNKISGDKEIKIMAGNTSALNGQILNDGKRSVVGYENGDVRLWDLKNCTTIFCLKELNNDSTDNQITSLAVRSDNSVIATGYINSKLKLINLTTGRTLFENKKENQDNSVEALVFCKSLPILAVAYLEGDLDIWDLNTFTKRVSIKLESGITKLILDSNQDHLMFASLIDGSIKLFDIRDLKQLNEYTGHRKDVLDFIISTQNNFILSCSDDSTCKLFRID